jgi:hypothetical protein
MRPISIQIPSKVETFMPLHGTFAQRPNYPFVANPVGSPND